ncbi:MAG: V-type ATP synthase subunit E [Trueperaceae bacterium]
MADLAALLDKEASAEIDAILAEARERASAIVAEAEREAEALVAARERQAQAQRQAARVRARSAAQLEAASMRLNAQQEAIQSVFRQAEEELAALPNDKERYESILKALLDEALEGTHGSVDALVVHPNDADLAKKLATSVADGADVRTDDAVRLGVKVINGRTAIVNSLPARLEALRDELASEVASALTSKEG